ncbi:MAG: hypothetical protein JWR15_1437 [Prosthecobacter sp.]|nr:hypothetical protein [Prosthecobacter sp.]
MKAHLLLAAFCLAAPIVHAQDLLPPITQGQRVATCGHSFHVCTYKQVDEIAKSAGLDHQLVGLSSIGGSTVQKHWDVPEEKSAVKQVLKAGKADVLTLSPIWLPDDAIEQFVKLGIEHNPALRITVQEYWMPNDEYNPVYPLDTRKKIDHNATDIAKLRDATTRYSKDIEDLVRSINQRLGKDAVLVVPVGLAAVTLREKILKGEAPGLKTQVELFRDTWGHALAPLQILSSYCHFAVIYRRSPAGLPVPNAFKALKDMSEDDKAKLNKLLQDIAWDTVSHRPMAGVMKPVAAK